MLVSTALGSALMLYRYYFFGSFTIRRKRYRVHLIDTISLFSLLKDNVKMSYEKRVLMYDVEMMLMLLRHSECASEECQALLSYFEQGHVSYVYGLSIEWSSMPHKIFQLYTKHVSRLLYTYETGCVSFTGSWKRFDTLCHRLGVLAYGSNHVVDDLWLSRVCQRGFRVRGGVLFACCDAMVVHARWLSSIVKRLCDINDRELCQRGRLLISLSSVQHRHIEVLRKRDQEVFEFCPPSLISDNRLQVSLDTYMNFMMRMKDTHTGRLGFCSGFMLIWSALPHDWLFGSRLTVKDQKRWLVFLPCMYKHLFVREGCFYTYDKRISWGKKFYGCTLFYYCMLKKKYGDYVEYYSGLRDQILNEFL